VKTLALQSGDLVIGQAGHKTITGLGKIRQDLALALGEELGNDRFHPQWGSTLPKFVGMPIVGDTEMLVRSEIARVIQSYISVQQSEVVNDSLAAARTRYSTADVVAQVTAINTSVSYDTIRAQVTLRTVSQQDVSISRTLTL
jgi:phage baseplate assembly protein W